MRIPPASLGDAHQPPEGHRHGVVGGARDVRGARPYAARGGFICHCETLIGSKQSAMVWVGVDPFVDQKPGRVVRTPTPPAADFRLSPLKT